MPNLKEEKKLWKLGYKRVAGIDEAGRGPLAGPVVAAAISFAKAAVKTQDQKLKTILKEAKDSKKLTAKKREKLFKLLTKHPTIKWGIGKASVREIDKFNIKNAAELAMWRAFKKIKPAPNFLLIDGNHIKNPELKKINHKLIVKGDEKIFSCAAASIIAKVWRDKIMEEYHKKYPQYRFDKHKGYPTKLHKKLLKKYGPCLIHRRSFHPVRKCIILK